MRQSIKTRVLYLRKALRERIITIREVDKTTTNRITTRRTALVIKLLMSMIHNRKNSLRNTRARELQPTRRIVMQNPKVNIAVARKRRKIRLLEILRTSKSGLDAAKSGRRCVAPVSVFSAPASFVTPDVNAS